MCEDISLLKPVYFISVREMCRNWDTNAVVGHWSVTGK